MYGNTLAPLIHLLIDEGANVDNVDKEGNTPLSHAVKSSWCPVLGDSDTTLNIIRRLAKHPDTNWRRAENLNTLDLLEERLEDIPGNDNAALFCLLALDTVRVCCLQAKHTALSQQLTAEGQVPDPARYMHHLPPKQPGAEHACGWAPV